ncbi:fatty acid synthase alpha subunit Lsd1, partial [Coemansia biformis]
MVYVRGLAQPALKAVLAEFNEAQMSDSDHVHLAVTNSHDQFVVAGTILSAVQLVAVLRERSAQPDEDQSKVPFSRRRPVITASYVDITVPYHSALLEGAVDLIHTIALDKQWVLAAADMQIPVRACDDGHDIRSETDLTRYLIESICVLPVDWPQAVAVPGATHIVDFGTGGFGGFGQLAQKSVEGRGTAVICAGQLLPQTSQSNLGTRADLYQREMAQVISAPDWLAVFGPRLVRTAHDSKVHIDTRMTRTLGMGTVMVAGMEPTTGNMGLVAAIYNAGYHAEVGAGTIHSEEDMEDRLAELSSQIAPGQGITLNCIYINPRQWTFQYPVILRLRSEGVPITGLCIGGGVPTFAKALELIGELRATGIRHIAFKPSNPKAIRHVVRIAQAAEGFPVILQWTGGRAGGHHSYEDFHQPILETYAAIRACANVALVAGSGFGDAAGSLPYMTGEWSIRYGRAPMPFDGILLGSRIMVAKEAGTSLAAKELIVAAAGLPDSEWDKTYDGVHNGITVFESEYGELNHSLGTRAIAFIKDMRRIILSQPRDKQQAQLLAQKDEIIARLNSDYMRPWFGKKADGRVVDLEDMTYAEVVERMVELMYVKHQQRWIHKSYRQAIVEFVSRAERRMASASPDAPLAAELSQVDPLGYAARLIEEYPAATTQLLASEDVQFFIALCKRRGQKPFPFIPVLDGDFGVLMLKNTGWTSEDVDSLVDQDVQRVGIQQGPVAAQYSTIVNEPVKDILDGIYLGHIASLVERLHDGDESSIPTTDYIGGDPAVAVLPGAVRIEESEAERAFWMPSEEDQLPELDAWLLALAGLRKGWLHALVTAPHIAQGAKSVDNYVRRLLRPRAGRKVAVRLADGLPTSIVITGSAGAVEMEVHCSADRAIRLTIHHQTLHGIVVPLTLEFSYDPSQVLAPIHGSRQRDDDVVQQFAIGIWSASADEPEVYVDTVDPDEILRDELTITESHSRALCENIGNRLSQYAQAKDGRLAAPMEFLYVPTLRSILRVLQSSVFGSGQVNVVHLHNQLAFEDGVSGLHVGDTVAIAVRIDGIENLRSGKKLTLTTSMHVDGRKVGSMKSAFLSRSHFVDTAKTFERNCDQKITILLPSSADIAVLEMKEWFFYREDAPRRIEPGVEVEFALDSLCHFSREGVYSAIATTGTVSVRVRGGRSVHIADVDFGWGAATKNPVIEYLKRYRVDAETRLFENDGYSLTTAANAGLARAVVPATNWDYAKYSLDCNPFHLNPYIADFADLPEPITHGLWTGASTRAVVEAVAAVGHPERVRLYRTTFTGMVFPRAELNTELFHVGMKNGRMLVKGLTSQVGGGSVMELVAEVDQPKTAYIFTGQGAQEAGMGMRLYEQSAVARDIWDRANKHMLKTYDIDLLDIVRTNPKELTVYFHGKGGKRVRRSYMALSKRVPDKSSADGFRLAPIIPEITAQSRSHTFRSPTGLLNATQFTQTTLILVATAAVADMRAKGLVQSDAMFAGHSLGEYCALAALGDIFSLEGLLDITFYRGMIMQSAIPRDEQGRSEFGMVAVDPSRVAKGFGEDQLHLVADEICAASPGLLQIVNYNVRGHQYVAAGTLTNLSVLRLALDAIAATGIPIGSDDKTRISEAVSSVLAKPVGTEAVRGRATIPLHGIDVPFHSRQLVDGVPEFRDALRTKINCDSVSPDVLHRRYIPNLTAVPFEVSRAYFEMVYELTGSPVMRSALDVWSDTQLEDAAEMTRLSVDLLVELLTYQFAAPVQWIKTQDCLFGAAEVQRMVEIGPSPVLCGMAAKTLRGPAFARKQVSLLHFERDQDEIYYRHAHEETAVATTVHTPAAPVELPKTEPMAVVQEPVATSPQPSSGAGAGEPIAEVPLQALDAVHAIVAFKVKQPLGGVSVQQNIKTLVAGKSTLQNEIIGDLQKEFGNKVPDKSEEVPLQELGTAIGTVDALGKCTQPLIARLFSSKMPGGFSLSSTRGILQSAYGLGPQRQDALLLVALTMEPAARLGSEADARSWLDGVAKAYASRAGISYASAAGAAAAGGQAQGPVVSSAEMDRMQKEQHEHARQQIAVLARYAGIDLRADGRSAEGERARASELQANVDGLNAELGEDFVEGIKPHFDARKARRFDSYWNWARQDAFEWIQQTIAGSVVVEDEARILQLQNCADEKLLKLLDGSVAVLNASEDPALAAAHRLATRLRDACKQALIGQPVYRELSAPMQPQTVISQTGSVSYSEVPRAGEPSLADYVEHMKNSNADSALPPLHMREKTEHGPWAY